MSARYGIAVALWVALLGSSGAQPVDAGRYAWQHPEVSGIAAPATMIEELRAEVQRVLDAGHLAPLYVNIADQEPRGYKIYMEPGRIITTLAWAYPYLTPAQQQAVQSYVAAELADARFAPWGGYPLPADVGARRERHPRAESWSLDSDFGLARPSVQTNYGLWLYAHRSGDRALIANYWDEAYGLYESRRDEADLYGTMGAHVAELRLAQLFGDAAERDRALGFLQAQLDAGLDFDAIEERAWNKTPYWVSPYRDMYDERLTTTSYRGWIFLNLTPEIGRYLRERVSSRVLERHGQGKERFPLWWVQQATYFLRSRTGDEGIGLLPEEIGMIAPLERFVVDASASTWREAMRSVPHGIGDCYWIEALVWAIEAHGTSTWYDVRRPASIAPTGANALRWLDDATLVWGADPAATSYGVRRGTLADLAALTGPANDSCRRWDGAATSTGPVVTEVPASGAMYWYLVVGVNAYGEGSAGRNAFGMRSQQSAGLCP